MSIWAYLEEGKYQEWIALENDKQAEWYKKKGYKIIIQEFEFKLHEKTH